MKGLYYDHTVQIDSRDVDGRGHCRPSALLGHLQEAATLAADKAEQGKTAEAKKRQRRCAKRSKQFFKL